MSSLTFFEQVLWSAWPGVSDIQNASVSATLWRRNRLECRAIPRGMSGDRVRLGADGGESRIGAEAMRAVDLCIGVCTGGVQTLSPGVSSASRGTVSRISNFPRYQVE